MMRGEGLNGHSELSVTRQLAFSDSHRSGNNGISIDRGAILQRCRQRRAARSTERQQSERRISELRAATERDEAAVSRLHAEEQLLRRRLSAAAGVQLAGEDEGSCASVSDVVEGLTGALSSLVEAQHCALQFEELEHRERCVRVAAEEISCCCASAVEESVVDLQGIVDDAEAAILPLREKIAKIFPAAQRALSSEPSSVTVPTSPMQGAELPPLQLSFDSLVAQHGALCSATLDLLVDLHSAIGQALNDRQNEESRAAAAEELRRENLKIAALQRDVQEAATVAEGLALCALVVEAEAVKWETRKAENDELLGILHSFSSQQRNDLLAQKEEVIHRLREESARNSNALSRLQVEEIPLLRRSLAHFQQEAAAKAGAAVTEGCSDQLTAADGARLAGTPYAAVVAQWETQRQEIALRSEELERARPRRVIIRRSAQSTANGLPMDEGEEEEVDVEVCAAQCNALQRQVMNLTVELSETLQEQTQFSEWGKIELLHDAEAHLQLLQERVVSLRADCSALKRAKEAADGIRHSQAAVRAQHIARQHDLQGDIHHLRGSLYGIDDEIASLKEEEAEYDDDDDDPNSASPSVVPHLGGGGSDVEVGSKYYASGDAAAGWISAAISSVFSVWKPHHQKGEGDVIAEV